MAIIIWIIVIMIIVAVTQKSKESQEQIQKKYEKKKQQNNSYYSNQKQEQYRKMNENHKNHEEPLDDVYTNIGYKKCPKCGTTVSKKSDTCFMCDYEFQKETKKPQE